MIDFHETLSKRQKSSQCCEAFDLVTFLCRCRMPVFCGIADSQMMAFLKYFKDFSSKLAGLKVQSHNAWLSDCLSLLSHLSYLLMEVKWRAELWDLNHNRYSRHLVKFFNVFEVQTPQSTFSALQWIVCFLPQRNTDVTLCGHLPECGVYHPESSCKQFNPDFEPKLPFLWWSWLSLHSKEFADKSHPDDCCFWVMTHIYVLRWFSNTCMSPAKEHLSLVLKCRNR